jgi:hypothetical protein
MSSRLAHNAKASTGRAPGVLGVDGNLGTRGEGGP